MNRPGLGHNPKEPITIGSQSVKKVQSDVHIDRKTFKVVIVRVSRFEIKMTRRS